MQPEQPEVMRKYFAVIQPCCRPNVRGTHSISDGITAFYGADAARTGASQTLIAASATAGTWLSAARWVMVAHYGEACCGQWANTALHKALRATLIF